MITEFDQIIVIVIFNLYYIKYYNRLFTILHPCVICTGTIQYVRCLYNNRVGYQKKYIT